MQNRLPVVDALRGLALFGILIANIPVSPHDENILSLAVQLFIDKKFITIFSILFGFGFYMQLIHAGERRMNFRSYFMIRMLILLLIGCMHAYLLWFGDIIRDYAICGMFLLLIYKWSVKRIIIIAIVFNVVLTGFVFIANGALGLQEYGYDTAIVREHPVATSYTRYLFINSRIDPFVNFVQDSPLTLVFCFGNMLIGLAMAKAGLFQRPVQFNRMLKSFIWLGATVGIACSYLFVLVSSGKLELDIPLIWLPFIIVSGMLLQSLFYISAFIKLFQLPGWQKFLGLFIPVGRMALTNYLLQTVFYLLFFFHWTHGLALYGKLNLVQTYLAAVILFSIQVLISRWWMKHHEHGPVEYVWKRLVYRTFG